MIVADPGMTGAFEAISAAGPGLPAKEVANFVSGAHAQGREGDRPQRGGDGRRVVAGRRSRRCWRRSSRAGSPVRPGASCSTATSRTARPRTPCSRAPGPGPISDDAALLGHVDAVIAANPKAVEDYRAGKPVAGFFVGQVMKATGGAADAARVTVLVAQRLDAGG